MFHMMMKGFLKLTAYIVNNEINNENKSKEHIIQNAKTVKFSLFMLLRIAECKFNEKRSHFDVYDILEYY